MAGAEGKAAGVSSFGMSGVNGHGLFTAPPELRAGQGAALQWQTARLWPLALNHNLLLRVAAGAGVTRCSSESHSAFQSTLKRCSSNTPSASLLTIMQKCASGGTFCQIQCCMMKLRTFLSKGGRHL